MTFVRIAAIGCTGLLAGAALAGPVTPPTHIVGGTADFGRTANGRVAHLYTLTNKSGLRVRFTDYGGVITEIDTPDRVGKQANVVLGFRTAADYETRNGQMPDGGPRPPQGNTVDAKKRYWSVSMRLWGINHGAVLTLVSRDGDAATPGTLTLRMRYTLTEHDVLRIDYRATATKPTMIDPADPIWFNLAGAGTGDVGGHLIEIRAVAVAETDMNALQTGRIVPAAGPLELRSPRMMRDGIVGQTNARRAGIDTTYVLANAPRPGPVFAARVTEPGSGRMMEVYTTAPAISFSITGEIAGPGQASGGRDSAQHSGFALAPQRLPDGGALSATPPMMLRPGQSFRATTIYKFVTPVDRLHR